eukprot:CAMPEP_0116127310 /NCGR_PEP_ID=MMETSP0329-20121206/6776_1 /TAXON_ID=697910 /ORGANISM="Pseudo-nitzschia arenysensis, Strain B593" /LENGTH=1054 /DNA_ID=CAMNT_0003621409 /DNA_START=137 /DNA_END=3301 /DNA_ORIENTATION=+
MRRHHNDTAVTTSTRIIPTPSSLHESQFIGESTSCLSMKSGSSSNALMIATATSTPCGTPPRKKWEGAFNKFLRGKNPENSPTLSSSPSSATSNPVTEDLSTGTAASGSSSVGAGGGMKGTKKKSSFSLIPGSKRLVSRNAAKNSSFSKGGSNGNLFRRGHKSMDALDVPLRKGSERSKSNGTSSSNPASPNGYSLDRRERSGSRSSSISSQPATAAIRGIASQSEYDRSDNKTPRIIAATLPTARSSLDAQLRACSVSSIPSYIHPYPQNSNLERTPSGDWHINPIVNKGVELSLGASPSAPSLTQLQPQRSQSRTYVYSSSSNASTPIYQYQPREEVDLRMVPDLPSLKGLSNKNRTTSLEFHDVGLNLDDSDNCITDDNHSSRSRNSYNSNNTVTIITDSGIPEPPDTLDEILGGIGGLVTVHSSSSSHLLSKMEQQIPASPETKKAFTKIHNSSEYGQDNISPFLGGTKASNVDLAGAHRSCIATQQSMLLRSMNSNQNIHSGMMRQFGSIPRTSHMELVEASQNSPKTFLSQSLPSSDQHAISKNSRLLKPIQSADSWVQGRRYLIAPAALAACPLSTIKSLTGLSTQSAKEAARSVGPPKASGAIELGDAFMTYVGDKYHLTCGKWSSCRLVLRQNYLFEYDLSPDSSSLPRGIAHLQHAVAYTQHDFDDALELHFYASPCAKVDLRVLLIRVKNKEERDDWITCLNKAARLQISDIWDYEEDSPLGTGRYASIYPARRKASNDAGEEHRCDQERMQNSDDGNNCALKVIDKSEFWRLVLKGRERCDTIVRELAVQSTLTAKFGTKPTFLQIRGFFETSEKVVVELELLDEKDLFEYISSKGVLEEDEAGMIIRDVLVALQSMSRAGIAHRDIKPANILMTKCDESKYGTSVKLGDFGMSTLVGVDGLIKGRCGSPGYVAPEILKAGAGEGYRNQVDMFSTGVTLYLMLCGYEPFYGESEKELIKSNKMANVDFPESEWSKISPEGKDMVVQMLKADPKERITADDALKHPWTLRLSQAQKDHREGRPENGSKLCRDSDLERNVCAIM